MKVDFYICPECGAEVRVGSKGCVKCASERATKHWDEAKSWEQDEVYDGLDLPDDEFDYDEFLEEEFGGGRKPWKRIGWLWWTVAVVLLVVLSAAVWRLC